MATTTRFGRAGNRWQGGQLRVTTFNARGLLVRDKQQRKKQMQHLYDVMRSVDVIYLQEVHGEQQWLQLELGSRMQKWVLWFSGGTGAVATLARRSRFDEALYDGETLAEGRILRTVIQMPDTKFIFWNVHNYGLQEAQIKRVERQLMKDHDEAVAAPGKSWVIFGGDLNYKEPDEPPVEVAKPDVTRPILPAAAFFWVPRWKSMLDKGTAVVTKAPSHFDRGTGTVARLDRFTLMGAAHAWSRIQVVTKVTPDPVALDHKGISDHAPVGITMQPKAPRASAAQPIAPEIFKHPTFEAALNNHLPPGSLDGLAAPTRLWKHKQALRAAGAEVRKIHHFRRGVYGVCEADDDVDLLQGSDLTGQKVSRKTHLLFAYRT